MIEENKMQPLSASESGRNAYYLPNCEVIEHSPAYASCLDKLRQIKEKKTNGRFTECVSAVRNGRCKAADMRQEEELKGQAVYFVARVALTIPASPNWDNYTPKSKPPHQRFVVTTHSKANQGGSYADAINAAMQTLPKPVFTAPKMVAGETPIQFARRLAAIT